MKQDTDYSYKNENDTLNDGEIIVYKDMPITELNLCGRAKNALHKNGIWTVGEMLLAVSDPSEVLAWQGVGKTVSNDILDIVGRMKVVEPRTMEKTFSGDRKWKIYGLSRQLLEETGELSIQKEDVPPRTYARIRRNLTGSLLDYMDITPEHLDSVRNIGPKTAHAICTMLAQRANLVYITTFDEAEKADIVRMNIVDVEGNIRQVLVPRQEFIDAYAEGKDKAIEWAMTYANAEDEAEDPKQAEIVLYNNGDGCARRRRTAVKIERALRALGIEMRAECGEMITARILSLPNIDEENSLVENKRRLNEALMSAFIDNKIVKTAIKKVVESGLRQKGQSATKRQIVEMFPELLRDMPFIESIIQEMLDENLIFKRDDEYLLMYEHVRDWVDRYPDERKRKILQLRLNGGTLEDVGSTVGLTRERVRQIVSNCLMESRFYEDHLAPVYRKYNFDDTQAQIAFGVIEGIYLSLCYQHGTKPLEDALDDDELPTSIRLAIQKALDRDYIHDGNYLVKRQSNEVKNHIIRTQCHECMTVSDYIKKHAAFCRKYNLDPQKFSLDDQSIANKLHDSMITITTYGKKFRYYPTELMDYTDLFEELDFNSYNDVEYSTQYFFVNHPQLMEQYDIRDFCELHNLLKKVLDPEKYPHVSFGRMPVIRFGNPDREAQVRSLLMEYAPEIENMKLAKIYEERYGVSVPTFIANYTQCIREYFFSGKYQMNVKPLPKDRAEHMKQVLTEDFYITEKLREIYVKEYPGSDPEDIVPVTIRQIGFHPYQGYAVRAEKYRTSTDFIEHLLLDHEEIYTSSFPPKLTVQHLFSRLYMVHKQNFEIFEVEPGHLVRLSYFEKIGITKKDFDHYIEHAAKYEMPGMFFSIHSLRKHGFRDPLDKLKMSDWFYASLLQQRPDLFSLQRVGGAKIIRKGHKAFNAASVFEQVIRENGPMTSEELANYMTDVHGAVVDKNRLMLMIPAAQLFYDRVTKTIFLEDETLEEKMAERRKEFEEKKKEEKKGE
ncbi:MAG: hypothetical protein IJ719_05670 [Clostridia bacterium]|nr:hypothetical protein [Clostridia bacterium]